MGGKAGPGDKECGAGLGEECEARPGEKDGKPGLGEKDGKAGLGEETLLWLGLSLRRVGKGTPAVERPDNKVSSAFERSDLLGLCNSFTSARTLLVNALHPRPLAVHHLAGRQGREPSSRVDVVGRILIVIQQQLDLVAELTLVVLEEEIVWLSRKRIENLKTWLRWRRLRALS